ncbi:hypothetical protein LG272_01450 [Pseudidiomarina marina]|uniref:hypothetical protein n=1 Tax=Pseudidiomarina marina TaxID=502366 RepID=UPI00384C0AD6
MRFLLPIAFLTLLSLLNAKPVNANDKQRPDLGAEVILLIASTVGLSRDELNRSFSVISDFQSRKFALSELESLSDEEVLAKVNLEAEPYANIETEHLMLIAKRYEIETELLAARADVDAEKFRQFYRTFDSTLTLALRLNRYVSAKQNSVSKTNYSNHASGSYFADVDFDGPIIDCRLSCDAVKDQVWEDLSVQLTLVGDIQDSAKQKGSYSEGTVARIVDHESGNFIEVRKQPYSLPWVPVNGG